MRYQILKSSAFMGWYSKKDRKTRAIVDARLDRIEIDGHFGFINQFEGLIELKWVSGMRIYTFVYNNTLVVVLFGGNKNGQNKDIKRAKKIREEFIRNPQVIA